MAFVTMTSSAALATVACRPSQARGLPSLALQKRAPLARVSRSSAVCVRAESSAESSSATTSKSTLDQVVEIMGFGGVAPEMINGRVSMIAFVAAVQAEMASGESIYQQWDEAQFGISAFIVLTVAASFAPWFAGKGSIDPAESWTVKKSPFVPTPNELYPKGSVLYPFVDAIEIERWNGRAAMVGLSILALVEGFTHSALF